MSPSVGLERYRQISLSRPATTTRVKLALLRRGITDNLTSIYLCSLIDRVTTAFKEDLDPQASDKNLDADGVKVVRKQSMFAGFPLYIHWISVKCSLDVR